MEQPERERERERGRRHGQYELVQTFFASNNSQTISAAITKQHLNGSTLMQAKETSKETRDILR
jgi:hypothetical protein